MINLKLDGFPFKAPNVAFMTKIYHPNVDEKGEICADMLEISPDKWAPTKQLTKIIDKIYSLMIAPNLDSPLNQQAAKDYQNNSWFAKAKQCSQQHAI